MGQYYMVVNTTKRQYIHPHHMMEGLKLLEFGTSSHGTMTGLAILLASGNGRGGGDLHSNNPIIGSWAGDRIVVAGDYADSGKHVPRADLREFKEIIKDQKKAEKFGTSCALYNVAQALFTDISEDVLVAMCDDSYLLDQIRDAIFEGYSFGMLSEILGGKRPKLTAALQLTQDDLARLRKKHG